MGFYSLVFLSRTLADLESLVDCLPHIVVAACSTSGLLYLGGTYHRIWNLSSGHEVKVLVVPTLLAGVVMTVASLLSQKHLLPLSVIWMGSLLSLTALTALRYRSRLIRGLHWRWEAVWWAKFPESQSTRVLIVGAGRSGQLLVRHIHALESKNKRFCIVGFADDDPGKQSRLIEGKPVLGLAEHIPTLVRQHNIDLIVLAVHNISGPNLRRIIDLCQESAAQVKKLPDILETVTNPGKPAQLRDIQIEDLIGRPAAPMEKSIDLSPLSGRVILVTGAAGSIGTELCRQLVTCAPQVLLMLDNNESGLFDIQKELETLYPQLTILPLLCDVTNPQNTGEIFRRYRPQIVFHAAAYKHVPLLEDHPHEAVRNNVGGTWNVASLTQTYGAERFILISSDKAVNSASVMGATKYICERVVYALAETNPQATTLMAAVRFGNVLGSRGSVVTVFKKQIANGGPVTVTDPRVTRYFMSIAEAVHLVIQAACMTTGKQLYMLEMGERVRIVELAEHLIRLYGLRPYRDIDIVFTGLRPGETLDEKLLIEGETRQATEHPYIAVVTAPCVDASLLLEKSKHLLNGHLQSESDSLKDFVRSLAHEMQEICRADLPEI
jgi:FlaA1/EpsC-like NDP-sugar epimerase